MKVIRRIVDKLTAFCNGINKIVGYITIAFFTVMFVSCLLQVFTRTVLNNSLSWTDELARYTFIWANMLGASVCVWTYGHASLTVVVNKLPQAAQKICRCFSEVVVFLIGYVLFFDGKKLLTLTKLQRTASLAIPMSLIYASIQVISALFMLYAFVHFLDLITAKWKEAKEMEVVEA